MVSLTARLPDRSTRARMLLVKLSSLGDVVNATPCFRALREYYPHAHLSLVVERAYVPLVQANPHLDAIVAAPPWQGSRWCRVWQLWQTLRAHRGPRFELAFDLQGTTRSAAWVYLSGARRMSGRGNRRPGWLDCVPWDPTRHAVENNLAVLTRLGIPVRDPAPELFVPGAAERTLDRILAGLRLPKQGLLVLAPFSRWQSKAWPDAYVHLLIERLHASGIGPIVLLGGPEDCETVHSDKLVSLVGKLQTAEMMALCGRARLLVTVDTGPMHVAAARGTPLVALFGPTWPEHSGPWGCLDAVIQAQRPDQHHCYRRDDHANYMHALTVERVYQTILARWQTAPPPQATSLATQPLAV